jgi:hypothetical protein
MTLSFDIRLISNFSVAESRFIDTAGTAGMGLGFEGIPAAFIARAGDVRCAMILPHLRAVVTGNASSCFAAATSKKVPGQF